MYRIRAKLFYQVSTDPIKRQLIWNRLCDTDIYTDHDWKQLKLPKILNVHYWTLPKKFFCMQNTESIMITRASTVNIFGEKKLLIMYVQKV